MKDGAALGGEEGKKVEEGERSEDGGRGASPGLGEAWMSVDSAGLPSQPEHAEERAGGQEGGAERKQPDFFTALSMNGLTQELAGALT